MRARMEPSALSWVGAREMCTLRAGLGVPLLVTMAPGVARREGVGLGWFCGPGVTGADPRSTAQPACWFPGRGESVKPQGRPPGSIREQSAALRFMTLS